VVDDGSSNRPARALEQIKGIQLLRHSENLGKGAALLTGLKAAAAVADWACTLDADGQHDAGEARRLMEAVAPEQRPIVIGRRLGMEGPNTPWTSRFGRLFSNFWIWLAGGHYVKDSQSGFRLYPLPEILELDLRTRRFQFEVEALVLARWKGVTVKEVPVRVHYDPPGERVSHFRPFVDFWRNAFTFTRLIFLRLVVPPSIRARRKKVDHEGR